MFSTAVPPGSGAPPTACSVYDGNRGPPDTEYPRSAYPGMNQGGPTLHVRAISALDDAPARPVEPQYADRALRHTGYAVPATKSSPHRGSNQPLRGSEGRRRVYRPVTSIPGTTSIALRILLLALAVLATPLTA